MPAVLRPKVTGPWTEERPPQKALWREYPHGVTIYKPGVTAYTRWFKTQDEAACAAEAMRVSIDLGESFDIGGFQR